MTHWNVLWHQRDLRIVDNPALIEAAKSGKVIPLFIDCLEEEGKWPKGEASKWWLYHSLEHLDKEYGKLGTSLLIQKGKALDVFKHLTSQLPIQGVYSNRSSEPHFCRRNQKIEKYLKTLGISSHCFEGNYLITPTEVLNKTGQPYSVFTPFYKACLRSPSWRSPLPSSKEIKPHRLRSDSLKSLSFFPKSRWGKHLSIHWEPGRDGAVKRLKVFSRQLDLYPKNRDIPIEDGTSRLSPHLHFGEISPHEIWQKIENPKKDRSSFLRQLIWREFGNYFLFHFPESTDRSWKVSFEKFPWKNSRKTLRAWQEGMTGYPIVDAGMRELQETGWMHNRVRMIVGSFLVKDLFIHWKQGAKWFWKTLVDADLGNNTLGWQWVAGSGPDAAPYFRIFNPILQGKKFDPKGEYIRKFVPELVNVPTEWIHAPWESDQKIEGYPPPIVDHFEAREKALKAYKKLPKR